MKLKQVRKIGLISAVSALTLFSSALPAFAVDKSVTTQGDVGFEKDESGTTDPLDPEKPDPLEPFVPGSANANNWCATPRCDSILSFWHK